MTPAGEVTEYDLEAVTPSGIAVGPENRIWITRNGAVISFDPGDPVGSKDLTDLSGLIGTEHSIVLGPDGNLWVATNDKLVKVPPAAPATATEVPVPGLTPKDIDAAGPGNTLWVTLEMTKKVGRVSGLEPPALPRSRPARRSLAPGSPGAPRAAWWRSGALGSSPSASFLPMPAPASSAG